MRTPRYRILTLLATTSVTIGLNTVPSLGLTSGDRHGSISVDEPKLDGVGDYLEEMRAELGLLGMATGIVHDDEIVFLRGYGELEDGGPPVGPDSPFLIASLSKSLTALALIQQVERGRVDLDAPVTAYLPEVAPGGAAITVRDLVHHRSGLNSYTGVEPFAREFGSSLQANVERLGRLLHESETFAYSNANYDILALIVQRASEMPFADYMRERVFEPLDMDDSYARAADVPQAELAKGHYRWLILGFQEHLSPTPPGVAGSHSMFSTADDLTHVLIAQLNGGIYRGTRVASEDSIRTLHEPVPYGSDPDRGYAGGWHVEPSFPPGSPAELAALTTLWHGGSSPAYRSVMWMIPEAKLGFVVLANGNDLTDASLLPQVAQGVKALLFDLDPAEVTGRSPLLMRWSKQLLLGVVIGQIGLAVAGVHVVKRLLRGSRLERRQRLVLAGASVLDLVALSLILWVIPSVGNAPLAVVLDQPDYRVFILAMVVGLGWGVIRSTLMAIGFARVHSIRDSFV